MDVCTKKLNGSWYRGTLMDVSTENLDLQQVSNRSRPTNFRDQGGGTFDTSLIFLP